MFPYFIICLIIIAIAEIMKRICFMNSVPLLNLLTGVCLCLAYRGQADDFSFLLGAALGIFTTGLYSTAACALRYAARRFTAQA